MDQETVLTPAEYKEQTQKYKAEAEASLNLANTAKREAEEATEAAAVAKGKQTEEEGRLTTLEDRRKKVAGEVADLNTARDTALSEKTKAEHELKSVQDEKATVEGKITNLQTHLADLEQAKTDEERKFNTDCKQFDAQRQSQKDEIEALKTKIKGDIARHDARMVDLNQQEADLTAVITARTTEAETVERRVKKLTDEVERLNGLITTSKAEIEQLKKDKLALEGEIKEAEDRRDKAVAEAVAREDELKQINDEKFALAQRTALLDEREVIIRERYQRAGISYE